MKTRLLPVKLTDEEILSRARDMSQALSDKTQKEEEAKSVASRFKSDVSEYSARCNRLGQTIASGEEYRDVEVEDRPDFAKGVMETYRMDTGEFVTSRSLRDDERQPDIPFPDGPVEPAKKGGKK